MKEGFRQCMAWLHTWSGLVVGWILYFIFVTGTVGYFYLEVDRWMRPELPLASRSVPVDEGLRLGLAHLRARAPDAERWSITLPGGRNHPHLSVNWRDPAAAGEAGGRRRGTTEIIDPATGQVSTAEPRETGGGFLLYRMHWQLHYLPRSVAYWIVGISSMLMWLALITGIVTHKKIFKDFFTFRPGKGQRSWLDVHNVVSVTSLPFFLMITYTGLMFLMYTLMPVGRLAVEGDTPREQRPVAEAPAAPAPLASFDKPLAAARAAWGSTDRLRNVSVEFPGRADAVVALARSGGDRLSYEPPLRFDGVSGEPIAEEDDDAGAARATQSTLYGLHEGNFAGIWLRWLYFTLGLLGCGMIATGLVLWTVKRRPQRLKEGGADFGHALVEKLNVGTIAGLPVAIAAYFWANRLLPVTMANRGDWEVHTMFAVWALMLLYPLARPLMRAWIEEFRLAALLFALLPLLNLFTSDRHLGVTLAHGDWQLAGFDLTVLAMASLFGYAAHKVARRAAAPPPARRRAATASATTTATAMQEAG